MPNEGLHPTPADATDSQSINADASEVSIVPTPTDAKGPAFGHDISTLDDSVESDPAGAPLDDDTAQADEIETGDSATIDAEIYAPTDETESYEADEPQPDVDESDDPAESRLDLSPTTIGAGPANKTTTAPTDGTKTSPPAAASTPLREPALVAPAKPLPPLTRQLMYLRSRVRSVLNGYYRKPLNSHDNDPWEAMHGMLAYESQSRIRQGGSRGDLITSVGWLCYNKPCKGQTLLHVTRDGELRAKYGVGLQGHLGQLLAMLAQCHVSPDYPIRVGQQQFTVRDLIDAEKLTCYPKSELTFKLLAFQYYLDTNETWFNDHGEEWSFPRLIQEELAQPMRTAACGGTHRLSSLSLTLNARRRRGEAIDGEFARAAEFVERHHQYAFRLQNRDGSLSTAWFNGRGDEDDPNRRIKTTGHMLEWLCYSLTDEELRDPRMIRAVSYLANLMYTNYREEWEVGPVSHATHALLLYDERVFMPYDRPGYTAVYRPRNSTALRAAPNAGRR